MPPPAPAEHLHPHRRVPLQAFRKLWTGHRRSRPAHGSLGGAGEITHPERFHAGNGWYYPLKDQPLRMYGFRYLFASALFVIFIFTGSYSTLPSVRSAMTPSSIHSTNGAAT